MNTPIHVAVGVVKNADGDILIARRPAHLHQGGLWEFPGGKVEAGEDVTNALRRELHEEIGIQVVHSRPLISLVHDYGDKTVRLDVQAVDAYEGEPHGCEGQAIRWVASMDLPRYEFPAANRAILNAVRLPDRYMITGEFNDDREYLQRIGNAIEQGVRLIQLRAKQLNDTDYLALAKQIVAFQTSKVLVLLNTSPEIFIQTDAAGLHLSSQRLMEQRQRPISTEKLLSASVHNEQELHQANLIGVDLLLVSPVMRTVSHPEMNAMGWDKFGEFVAKANCSIYALGGMNVTDIAVAKQYGAQGVAGISLFEEAGAHNNL